MKEMKVLLVGLLALFISCQQGEDVKSYPGFNVEEILNDAIESLSEEPVTITKFDATRSNGGKNDYYSEGRYWWPDSTNLDGPYIRRDGLSNPELFTSHRDAVKAFEKVICDMTVAALITGNRSYSEKIIEHLNAWFVNSETMMNPRLLYAQAIKGIVEGRGIGMIDIIGLINISNCVRLLEKKGYLTSKEIQPTKQWFAELAGWSTSHPYGIDEKTNNNNHSTWWGAQISAYGLLADQDSIINIAIQQYKDQLEIQMDSDGSLPDELGRTRPSHYMNYTLFAWTSYAQLLGNTTFNPWNYSSSKGTINKAVDFGYKYFVSPEDWPYRSELEEDFNPEHNEFLFLAGLGLDEDKYIKAWMESNPTNGSSESSLLIWKMLEE